MESTITPPINALNYLSSQTSLKEHETFLTSTALYGLMCMGASKDGHCERKGLISGVAGTSARMTADDEAELLSRGLMENEGKRWVRITDKGNRLMREMLAFADTWEGGGL